MQRNSIIEINNNKKTAFNWMLFASIVLISSMVLIRDIGVASISPALFVMATVLISIFLPYNSLRSFSFFYIVGGVGIHGGALAAIVVALLIKSRKKNIYQFVFTLIILLFELIHFSTYSFKVDFNKYFIFGLFITFFFFLLFDDTDNNEGIYADLRYYVIGTAVALFIIVLHSVLLFGIEGTLLGNIRLGTGFDEEEINDSMVTQLNSNYMAYYSIVATALVLFVKNLFNKKWLKYILLIILVLAGIMSSSRTWILLMVLVVIIHFLVNRKRARFEIIIVTILLMLFASKYSNYTEALIGRFEERFEEENIATAGSRTKLIAQYNRFLADNPAKLLYGTGSLYYRRVSQQPLSTHNGTQQLIVCYGLIGVLIFVWCGIVFYKRYYTKSKKAKRYLICIPFFMCLLFLQTIQFISPPSLMLPLAATLLPLKLNMTSNESSV